MRKDSRHFESFVAEPFARYVDRMAHSGVFGDHVEIQAMAELYGRPVVVYSTDVEEDGEEEDELYTTTTMERKRVKTLNLFHSTSAGAATTTSSPTTTTTTTTTISTAEIVPLRLCYRGKNHYDAVIDPLTPTVGVGLGLDASFQPGKADADLINAARQQTDLDATQEALERSVALSSMALQGALSPAVRELVANGFALDNVLLASSVVGDSFDDILAVLLQTL
ncbi:hypothetical protein BASA82_000169 [Batrachochytrium salamandrivorans]|nr:hypothetical protein BASA82_000169 [Batrachochytrium salamandrivorans]